MWYFLCMTQEKRLQVYHIVKLVMFSLLALWVFILRNSLVTDDISFFVGSVILLYGIEEITFQIVFERKAIYKSGKAYFALMELIIGIALIATEIQFGVSCAVWACWSMLRESHEIFEVVNERYNIVLRIINLLESLVAIIFSVLLIINPTGHHVYIHIILLIIELITSPLLLLLTDYLPGKGHPEE